LPKPDVISEVAKGAATVEAGNIRGALPRWLESINLVRSRILPAK
jgi:hypothetical protein